MGNSSCTICTFSPFSLFLLLSIYLPCLFFCSIFTFSPFSIFPVQLSSLFLALLPLLPLWVHWASVCSENILCNCKFQSVRFHISTFHQFTLNLNYNDAQHWLLVLWQIFNMLLHMATTHILDLLLQIYPDGNFTYIHFTYPILQVKGEGKVSAMPFTLLDLSLSQVDL